MSRRSLLPLIAVSALLLTGCPGENDAPAPEPEVEAPDPGVEENGDPLTQGLQAHVEERYDDAIAAYQQVLEDDPENHLALYNLGLVEQSQGDTAQAEDYYRQTLEVEPEYIPALFNLAIIRSAEGAREEAVQLYTQIIEIDPEHAGAHLNLAFAHLEQGNEAAAQESFARAVELNPEYQDRVPAE